MGLAESWHVDMQRLLGTLPSFRGMTAPDQSQALKGVQWMAQVFAESINNRTLDATHTYLAHELASSPFWSRRFSPGEQAQLRNGLALAFANASDQQAPEAGLLGDVKSVLDSPYIQGAVVLGTGGAAAPYVAAYDAYGSQQLAPDGGNADAVRAAREAIANDPSLLTRPVLAFGADAETPGEAIDSAAMPGVIAMFAVVVGGVLLAWKKIRR